ncbi:MAG: cyclic nucleotide-binding domain-containing protein [Rhizobiaceae bacterium]
MRPSDLTEIRDLELFEAIHDDTFSAVMNAAYLQTFPAQMELIAEGDPADFLYIVTEGCVELFATSNGRETTMSMLKPVSTFILAAILRDGVYLMSARTCQKSKVLMIPAKNIRSAFEHDATFARSIVLELAGCYRGVIKEHKNLKLRSGVERLANRLLHFHKQQGANGQLHLPYDKRTLASQLAMSAENLSRAFNTLKPYGVEVDGMTIHLTDFSALEGLAKPNPLIDDRTV